MAARTTSPAFTAAIDRYIASHHVVSLAASAENSVWAANVFYSFDLPGRRLLFVTSPNTAHGRLMLANPTVAATISTQEKDVTKLQGIQLRGTSTLLAGAEADRGRKLFAAISPVPIIVNVALWALAPTYLKMVDNSRGFSHKEEWPQLD
ncbi:MULTISPECIES: pyridoxamine 5'-phosphate oxidase family protein [unclassified Cryobacterium]|uniref:pyridoxamine 5'-phosphate oxidase family protein n=1 Tax=unclassified Cryobacterium TaxID=2649013 RepID=UPI002AB3C7A7|nr:MULTISPECIES: pyridoxamine 5'-phosphate oxidase family protein [Cryobacterium]MDY7544441.1 pyridoxamine 5'-phosphate oxidase family protein [Cryobacterium sp. 5B3]MEB0000612.1 pyridoxamine 5'-phosphate oxidase family protein [Cryobacterium sp. RTS3]MEB0267834.1 pyridoxamine 5'-phosphate oxidase family protein [Cryobacterium sp. 10I5]MEB0276632.1 pyridoxamine 5'-phosphate oxidase family protein [Cryobacterium sp. 5B3]MEB0288699.1 pyridoxamine 5'-phosphate oxidase family protein [Cryobacteriu